MIGLDTNVLVRFRVRDDEMQFARARRLLQREMGKGELVLINLLVILETDGSCVAAMLCQSLRSSTHSQACSTPPSCCSKMKGGRVARSCATHGRTSWSVSCTTRCYFSKARPECS